MKFSTLATEGLTLEHLLAEAKKTEAVFLTQGQEVRFVIMPADDGDQEVCALRNSPEFMAYLEAAVERARKGRRYSLEEIKARHEATSVSIEPKANPASEVPIP